MMGFSVGGWEDNVDPDRVRMDLVEGFEACISENGLWGKGGPAESQLLVLPEAAPQKSSAKRSAPPDTVGSNAPTKRPKIERTSSG